MFPRHKLTNWVSYRGTQASFHFWETLLSLCGKTKNKNKNAPMGLLLVGSWGWKFYLECKDGFTGVKDRIAGNMGKQSRPLGRMWSIMASVAFILTSTCLVLRCCCCCCGQCSAPLSVVCSIWLLVALFIHSEWCQWWQRLLSWQTHRMIRHLRFGMTSHCGVDALDQAPVLLLVVLLLPVIRRRRRLRYAWDFPLLRWTGGVFLASPSQSLQCCTAARGTALLLPRFFQF